MPTPSFRRTGRAALTLLCRIGLQQSSFPLKAGISARAVRTRVEGGIDGLDVLFAAVIIHAILMATA